MGWRDNYRQASWRGVEFFVESHDADFGRRQVTHEFPQRDEPFTEDLGRRARTYSIEAYLLGDDYDSKRDALQAECEKEKEGELIHPYLGALDLVCQGMKVRETNTETGICRILLSFIEAGISQYPDDSTDPVSAISDSADGVTAAAEEAVAEGFSIDGVASYVSDFAAIRLAGFSTFMQGLTINPAGGIQQVAAFFDDLNAIATDAVSLVDDAAAMASRVTGLIGQVRGVFGSGAESVLIRLRQQYPAPDEIEPTTPSQLQNYENAAALNGLFRRVAIAEQAIAIVIRAEESDVSESLFFNAFESRDEAIAARDEIISAIDVEIEDPILSTAEYQALALLRTEIFRGVPSASLRLPSIGTITPKATLPSLVVAYSIYEDANRSTEIAERNNAKHPGFLTGGVSLQVINDG